MENSINIVFVSDDNYIQHLGVTLTSLLENTERRNDIVTYVIHDGISLDNESKVKGVSEKYGGKINFIKVNSSMYKDLALTGHISQASYYKVSIPDLLSDDINKVLYIDCDMIVKGDIATLWSIDIRDYLIAATEDPNCQARNQALGIPIDHKYFNAGLMLMNLTLMRKEEISSQVFYFLRENKEKIQYVDQDGFNAILYSDWYELPVCWNVMHYYFNNRYMEELLGGKEIEVFQEAVRNPKIIHYTASPKPWEFMSTHPLKIEYYNYLSKTGWSNYEPTGKNFANIVRKKLMQYPKISSNAKKIIPDFAIKRIKEVIKSNRGRT